MIRFAALLVALAVLLTAQAGTGARPTVTTQTVTVTTNPSTFTVQPVFDLTHAGTVYVTLTITAINADGETFSANGLKVLWEDTAGFSGVISADGIAWASGGTGMLYAMGMGGAGSEPAAFRVGDAGQQAFATPRYLRVPVTIYSDAAGTMVYAGPNHPTVTVQIDFSY